MEKEISLLESLTGVNFLVDFLDGTKFAVSSNKGQVIKPNSLMTIEEKGLPFHKNPYKFGNLFVLFKIKFPESLNATQLEQVKTMLKSQKRNNTDENMDSEETVVLKPFSDDQKNTHAQGGTKAYNSDGEEEEDDPRMQGGAK
jgi:DnaJ-class molecular chaperone